MKYGKHFDSMYDGSMYGAGPVVFAVWGYVIAKTTRSRVELNPRALAPALGCSVDEVTRAIEYLCGPDPESRSSSHDGRRMIREGAFQYFVVNHEDYWGMKNEEDRREYNRKKQAEYRERLRVKRSPVTGDGCVDDLLPPCTQGDGDGEQDLCAPCSDFVVEPTKARSARAGKNERHAEPPSRSTGYVAPADEPASSTVAVRGLLDEARDDFTTQWALLIEAMQHGWDGHSPPRPFGMQPVKPHAKLATERIAEGHTAADLLARIDAAAALIEAGEVDRANWRVTWIWSGYGDQLVDRANALRSRWEAPKSEPKAEQWASDESIAEAEEALKRLGRAS